MIGTHTFLGSALRLRLRQRQRQQRWVRLLLRRGGKGPHLGRMGADATLSVEAGARARGRSLFGGPARPGAFPGGLPPGVGGSRGAPRFGSLARAGSWSPGTVLAQAGLGGEVGPGVALRRAGGGDYWD
jgi:hypothetical protein